MLTTNDGSQRANAALAVIEVFVRSLCEFAEIGTRMQRRKTLRTCPIPKLLKATVLFEVRSDAVLVHRISYLGRNHWSELPRLDVEDPIDISATRGSAE